MAHQNTDLSITSQRYLELKGSKTQAEFGRIIHLEQSAVSKLLNGSPPSLEVLTITAQAFHTTTDWILGLTNQKTPIQPRTSDEQPIGLLYINDPALSALLEKRQKLSDPSFATYKLSWLQKVYDHFADIPLIRWT